MRWTIVVLCLVLSAAAPAAEELPADMMSDWQERVEEAIAFVAAEDPRLAQELMELRRHDPDAFMREVFHIMLEREELERLSQTDQQRYLRALKERELERESHRLAEEWHRAAADEKSDIKTELKAVIDELFDVRELHRSDQIAELERELERLREALKTRQENKRTVIESRLKEMLGEEDHLRW
jgi:hypothetical protein